MILRDKTVLVTGGTGSFGTKFIEALLERHDPQGDPRFQPRRAQAIPAPAPFRRRRPAAVPDRRRPRRGPPDAGDEGRRRPHPRRRAEAGAGVRVQPLRGGADERPRRGERRQRRDRERRAADVALSAPTRPSTRSTSTARRSSAPRSSSTQGNAYAADSPARFANVRYGNVVGSRGSVIPLFKAQAEHGVLTITDERMTRFWITLEQAVDFVISLLEQDGRRRDLRAQDPEHAGHRHRGGDRARTPSSKIDRDPAGREAARGPGHRGRVAARLRARRQLRDPAGVRVVAAAAGRRTAQPARGRLPLLERHERRLARRRRASWRWRRTSRPCREHANVPPVRPAADRRGGHRGGRRGAARATVITQGPTIARFEEARRGLRRRAAHVVAFANGTAALHGAAFAAGSAPATTRSRRRSASPARRTARSTRARTPRFVDIDPRRWNLDMAAAAGAVGERTKAVIAGQLRRAARRPRPARRRPRPGRRDRGRLLTRSARHARRPAGRRARRSRHDRVLDCIR